ncbi:MAG: NAD(P)/FAD-dependent oxidoreductase [Ignavibacteriae bacterium]|nr:MAG: NAD(P)/FAD-dependent oxidoreductase [Ignavibacteriota bacterium]
MNNYKYIIIGGGMTGDSAVKGIREVDKDGSIAMFSREPDPPYNRPPLTKDLWKGSEIEKIWKKTNEQNVDIFLETSIEQINASDKTVVDSKGDVHSYVKLLVATGGTTIKLPFENDEVTYYRMLKDYEYIHTLSESKKDFAVIGSGFIGSEISAALRMNGRNVTMIFPENLIGIKIYPHDLAEYITDYYRNKGVNLVSEDKVKGIKKQNGKHILNTESGKEIKADHIIAGIGIKPDVALAAKAGVKTENGIIVDEFLRTNIDDIYAAGDAANFYNPLLDKRIRVEHADNANKMGKAAGRNMAGKEEPYEYLPFFYSDMFELGYEAIGELDSRCDMYCDWQEKFKKGVIYYLDKEIVVGVLLWNVWNKVNDARELIASKLKFKPEDLKGKII